MAGVGILDPKKGILWSQPQEMTPDQIARQRELADAILQRAGDTSPVGSWTQGAARVVDAIGGVLKERRADKADATNSETNKGLIAALLGTSGVSPDTVAAPGSAAATSGAASPVVSSSGAVAVGDPNDIQTQFLDTVKTGVKNPYGLAAIAATGKAESGWDPKNAGGTWADGKNPAGGIMSWNGPRLANLQKFSGGTNGTPEQQGQFFLQENPGLVNALNNAKSVEEAQHLMNNAWAFKGYDQPGNANAAHRLALATGYLPQFQGQGSPAAAAIQQQAPIGGQQVASLDPSAGMAAPAPAPASTAAFDPSTATPDQLQTALGPTAAPYQDPRVTTAFQGQPAPANVPVPMARPDVPMSAVSPQQAPQQVAQAAAQPQAAGNGLGMSPAIVAALTNPAASPQVKQIASLLVQKEQARQQALYEQQLKAQDPGYQADLRLKNLQADQIANPRIAPADQARLDLDKTKFQTEQDNRGSLTAAQQADVTARNEQLKFDREKFDKEVDKGQWQKMTDGRLYNQTSGEFRDAPPAAPGTAPVKMDDISGIRKEVQQLPSYKNLSQAAPIYKSMLETSGRDSKASDLNLVYGLGKIMDPTSVVREGEMIMVKNTASLPDWLVGAANALNGGAALQPETRKAIMREAFGRVTGYNNEFKQDMSQYQGIAKRYNINPDDIIPPLDSFQEPPTDAPQGGPVKIQSVDDYTKLQRGTQYVDPNGKVRVKN